MKSTKLLLIGTVIALLGFQAQAATTTTCGTDVCFTYDDNTLFGSASVIGNSIFFLPTDFTAESLNGAGSQITNTTLNIEIEAITEGFSMSQFLLQEQGDYYLQGDGASVSAGGQLGVTSLTSSCPDGGLVPCRLTNTFNAENLDTQGVLTDWDVAAAVNLNDLADWGSDTKVIMTIENVLTARSLNPGDEAFIQKKVAGVGITVVPVPAAVWLLGSALGGLGFMRRRKQA